MVQTVVKATNVFLSTLRRRRLPGRRESSGWGPIVCLTQGIINEHAFSFTIESDQAPYELQLIIQFVDDIHTIDNSVEEAVDREAEVTSSFSS